MAHKESNGELFTLMREKAVMEMHLVEFSFPDDASVSWWKLFTSNVKSLLITDDVCETILLHVFYDWFVYMKLMILRKGIESLHYVVEYLKCSEIILMQLKTNGACTWQLTIWLFIEHIPSLARSLTLFLCLPRTHHTNISVILFCQPTS